jgi:tetratricopeptide (TPR) repeat protein
VRRILDRYVGAWSGMYTDVCEATHVRGEQSDEVLDLRMSCLDERLRRVKALTDVFAEANGTVVQNAVAAASALPPLDRCADVKLLRAVVPPPDDPLVQGRVEALRRDLAHVKALGDSGQCAAAADLGRRLVVDAHAVGYLPLEAESLNAEARSSSQCLAADEAVGIYKQAVLAATASHDEEAVAEAMILLAHVEADRTTDVAQARQWIDLAGAVLRGMSAPHPVLESWRLQTLARILGKERRFDEALATLRRAQDLMETTQGPEHPDVANVTNNIGLVLEDAGRYDEALSYFARAERLAAKVLGPHHPTVALSLGAEGEALNALHRYDEAQVVLERAIDIYRRAGSSPFYTAWGLAVLGEALLGMHRPREAQAALEEALRSFPDAESPLMPATQFALARALWATPEHRPRALTLAQAARAGSQRTGGAPRPEDIDAWLGARKGR